MDSEVTRLLAMVDLLDDDRIAKIAAAYEERGLPHHTRAWIAASLAGREKAVGQATYEMTTQVQIYGITYQGDPNDIRLVAWAANNAGLGIATEDLIGSLSYSLDEYSRLVDPWFAGFADLPMMEREES